MLLVRVKGDLQVEPPGGVTVEPADHALGRCRGGLTTKLHLGCKQGQKPLSIVLTAGQRGDSPQFTAVLESIRCRASVQVEPGHVRTGPSQVNVKDGTAANGTANGCATTPPDGSSPNWSTTSDTWSTSPDASRSVVDRRVGYGLAVAGTDG